MSTEEPSEEPSKRPDPRTPNQIIVDDFKEVIGRIADGIEIELSFYPRPANKAIAMALLDNAVAESGYAQDPRLAATWLQAAHPDALCELACRLAQGHAKRHQAIQVWYVSLPSG